MEDKEVLASLCWYDPRNPDGEKDQEVIDEHNRLLREKEGKICLCENCFYGRTELAEYIISLKPSIVGTIKDCPDCKYDCGYANCSSEEWKNAIDSGEITMDVQGNCIFFQPKEDPESIDVAIMEKKPVNKVDLTIIIEDDPPQLGGDMDHRYSWEKKEKNKGEE